jgi:tripartite-type tricarboxylate transporter receptor subunit TctC
MHRSAKLRALRLGALALIALAGCCAGAQAQGYPSRTIRMVVAFTPGGPTDAMARLLADKLGDKLGQARHRRKRPGAGGNIGYESVAKSPPDGYTLAFIDPSLTVNPSLYTPAKYDAERDFTPISLAVRGPTVMTVPAAAQAKTVGEFIALARRNAGKTNLRLCWQRHAAASQRRIFQGGARASTSCTCLIRARRPP